MIRAQRTNQRLLAEATTGPQGDGSLTGLPEDDEFEITAHAQGFQTWRQRIRPVTSGGKLIEVVLQVATPSMGIFLDTRPPRKPWWRRLWR